MYEINIKTSGKIINYRGRVTRTPVVFKIDDSQLDSFLNYLSFKCFGKDEYDVNKVERNEDSNEKKAKIERMYRLKHSNQNISLGTSVKSKN